MVGDPVWNAFALLLSTVQLFNDQTYRRVITRNGPVPHVLKNMGVAVRVSHLSLKWFNQDAINPLTKCV